MWTDRTVIHVSLVILVIDDFTGMPVKSGEVKVSIPGQSPPVVKEDGCHVFWNLPQAEFTLLCESGIYERRKERVEISDWNEREIMVIRLLPNDRYPLPSGAICVSGRTRPKRHLLFWHDDSSEYRLLRDYECAHEEKIALYNPHHKMLVGKKFFICGKDNGSREYFRITGAQDEYFQMDKTLESDYGRVGSKIVALYDIHADKEGAFFLMVPADCAGQTKLRCLAEGDGEEKAFLLMHGKTNALVL